LHLRQSLGRSGSSSSSNNTIGISLISSGPLACTVTSQLRARLGRITHTQTTD
jgi:hypothetical protein